MTLHRNTGHVPLDGFADGRQVFVGQDVDLTDEDLELPLVADHVRQGVLVPVTMPATDAPALADRRTKSGQ